MLRHVAISLSQLHYQTLGVSYRLSFFHSDHLAECKNITYEKLMFELNFNILDEWLPLSCKGAN